jgi:hypothetical protein
VADPVTGPLPLTVTAIDDGLGLESATATVDGQVAASVQFGGSSCAPLAGPAGELDLPLAEDCPPTATKVPLTVATDNLSDGPHHLTVTVTDAAGNTTTAVDQTVTVSNHPDIPGSSTLLAIGSGPPPSGSSSTNSTGGGSGSGNSTGSTGVAGQTKKVKQVACASPRLTARLRSTPVRRTPHGTPVLWRGTRYLFVGRLTCVVKGKRVGAHFGVVVVIDSRVGRKLVPRTGAAVYRDGHYRVLLHPRSSRLIEFYYGNGKARRIVRIRVLVTRIKPVPHRKPAGDGKSRAHSKPAHHTR